MPHRGLAALAGALLALLAGLRPAGRDDRAGLPEDPGHGLYDAQSCWWPNWRSHFTNRRRPISLAVDGAGTGFGLEALRAGEADLALASWLPAELSPSWQATPIARDGIAIIVHPDNPIEGLGLLQLQDLFSGRAYEWEGRWRSLPAQGVVQPVSREEGSGTRAVFEALAMDGQRVTPRAVVVTSSQAVVDYVASHPQAIGYVSIGYLSPAVKALTVEREAPTSAGSAAGQLSTLP